MRVRLMSQPALVPRTSIIGVITAARDHNRVRSATGEFAGLSLTEIALALLRKMHEGHGNYPVRRSVA